MRKDIQRAERVFGLRVKDTVTLANEIIYIFEDDTAGTLTRGSLPQCRYPNLLWARANVDKKSLTSKEQAEFKRQAEEAYKKAH